jgi:phage shock protein C
MSDDVEDQSSAPPEPSGEEAPRLETAPPVAEAEPRRLRRSREDRVIAGVCGGLGEYLGVDAVLIRIAALILVFAGGAGIVLYIIGWIAMPEAPETETPEGAVPAPAARAERTTGAVALGLVFIVLGAFFLADELWPDLLSWKYVWPIALIAIGVAVLVRARR